MRDPGLQQAIRAAGGVSALAKRLGVAQPSISIWTRVPAERVLAVESVTFVPRSVLRPDLYPESADDSTILDAIDQTRVDLYLLLSHLILRVPDEKLLIDLRRLQGGEGAIGEMIAEIADLADVAQVERITREHFDLFIGVGRGELLPYASYYLTGFLYERPLVRARSDMKRLGIERGDGFAEPEDHIGFLLESMAGIIARKFAAEPDEEQRFFTRHLEQWAEKFFSDLQDAKAARFYRVVGRLGLEFMRIEREAFALEKGHGAIAPLNKEGARA